jgi:hypothetical protein
VQCLAPPVHVRWYSIVLLTIPAMAGSSCKGDPTGPPEPVKSILSCTQPNGQRIQCDLLLQESSGFALSVVSRECMARGNTLTLTKPTTQLLSDDACTLPVGNDWHFPGPYPIGTAVSLEITSPRLQHDPSLIADGTYPSWTLTFEDGFDQDFNDLVLRLQAIPSP